MTIIGKLASAAGWKGVVASVGLMSFITGAHAQDHSPIGVRHNTETAFLTGSTWPTIFDDEVVVQFTADLAISPLRLQYGITDIQFQSGNVENGTFVSRSITHSFDTFVVETTYRCNAGVGVRRCAAAPVFDETIQITFENGFTSIHTLRADYSLPVVQDLGCVTQSVTSCGGSSYTWPNVPRGEVELSYAYDLPYTSNFTSSDQFEFDINVVFGTLHRTSSSAASNNAASASLFVSCNGNSGPCFNNGPDITGQIYHSNNLGQASVISVKDETSSGVDEYDVGARTPFEELFTSTVWPTETATTVPIHWLISTLRFHSIQNSLAGVDYTLQFGTPVLQNVKLLSAIQPGTPLSSLNLPFYGGITDAGILMQFDFVCDPSSPEGRCTGDGPQIEIPYELNFYNDGNLLAVQTGTLVGNFASPAVKPELSAASIPGSYTSLDPITVTIVATEDLSGPAEASSLLLTNAANPSVSGIDATSFDIVVTPIGTGPIGLQIPAGAATDLNGVAAQAAETTIADGKVPGMTEMAVPASFNGSAAIALSATFDEEVTLSNSDALLLQNATLEDLRMVGQTVSMLIFPVDPTQNISVALAQGLVTDPSGNPSASVAAQSITAATSTTDGPVAAISPETYNYTDPFVATITFSEALDAANPLVLSDISIKGASLSNLSPVNSTEFTVQVTPDGISDVEFNIAENAVSNLAGNGNRASVLTIRNSGYVAETTKAIASFIEGRATQILANRPDYRSLANCDGKLHGRLNATANDDGYSGNAGVNRCYSFEEEWTGWSKIALSRSSYSGNKLTFALGQFGVQHRVNDHITYGLMGQIDYSDQENATAGTQVSGTGFMVGPYAVIDVSSIGSTLSLEALWGQSFNTVNPVGLYVDDFDTSRFLLAGSLSGQFDYQNWILTPSFSARYFEETQEAYVDTVGFVIPEQTIQLGEAELALQAQRKWLLDTGVEIDFSGKLSGIYTLTNDNSLGIANTTVTDGTFRPRFDVGLGADNGSAFANINGFNDGLGLGSNDYNSWGATVNLGKRF